MNLFPLSITSRATAVPDALAGVSGRTQDAIESEVNLVCKLERYASPVTPLYPSHWFSRCAVFGLIGALGVLALIFSALSPNDDDIQQEFAQGSKNRQHVVQNWKAVPSVRATRVQPVQHVFVGQSLPWFYSSPTGRVVISDVKIGAASFCNRIGGRSPPTAALL
jgi:hypothetical protein